MTTGVDSISSAIDQWTGNWMFIGEWSLATGGNAPFNDMTKFKQFAQRHLDAVNKAHMGWTYWTWKTSYDDDINKWSMRSLLRHGVFPSLRLNSVQEATTSEFLQ
jgi:aryl-phospho-beta-D-glucosidase BglC (GH1 family)